MPEAGSNAVWAMADLRVTPITSLAPGLHPCPEPEQGQLTRPDTGEVAYVSMGPTASAPTPRPPDRQHERNPPTTTDQAHTCPTTLDPTYSQLVRGAV